MKKPFNIEEYESEILEHRSDDVGKDRLETFFAIIASDYKGEGREIHSLETIRRGRKKAAADEGWAGFYEHHVLAALQMFVPRDEAPKDVSDEKPAKKAERQPAEGDIRLVWGGVQTFNGKEWIKADTLEDEDLAMETGYESHETIEGFGMKTKGDAKAGRGGARKGAGRKPADDADKKKQRNIKLYDWQVEKLEAHGMKPQQAIDTFINQLTVTNSQEG